MIQFHHFQTGDPTSLDEFNQDNLWGTIENGDVVEINDENGPETTGFEQFISALREKLIDGVIDPVAIGKDFDSGDTRAIVPSKTDAETVYYADDIRNILTDGSLGQVEQYETQKYIARESEQPDGPTYKEYELSKPYRELVIHTRSNGKLKEVARIDIQEGEVISVNRDHTFKSMLRFLKSNAPTMNPVEVIQLNTKTRVSAVVDPLTDELVFDKEEIKRPPEKIKQAVLA